MSEQQKEYVPKPPLIRGAIFLVVFMITWLVWSGLYKPLVIGLGFLSCLFAIMLVIRMPKVDGEDINPYPVLRAVTYLPWLLMEIAKANWDVTKIILSPDLPINPVLFRIRAGQDTNTGQVIYGNSITLTPGTITTDIHEGELIVHALTQEGADGVKSGEMDRRVAALEGGQS